MVGVAMRNIDGREAQKSQIRRESCTLSPACRCRCSSNERVPRSSGKIAGAPAPNWRLNASTFSIVPSGHSASTVRRPSYGVTIAARSCRRSHTLVARVSRLVPVSRARARGAAWDSGYFRRPDRGLADRAPLRRALHRHGRAARHSPRHLAHARYARTHLRLESGNADVGSTFGPARVGTAGGLSPPQRRRTRNAGNFSGSVKAAARIVARFSCALRRSSTSRACGETTLCAAFSALCEAATTVSEATAYRRLPRDANQTTLRRWGTYEYPGNFR